MKGAVLKKVIAVLCLIGSVLSLYNVYSDIGPIQKQAEQLACDTHPCAALIGMERSPIQVTFRFQLERNRADTAQVRCRRGLVLVGEYDCAKEFGPH